MSLAQITEKIERDARDEAEKILARSREQAETIKRETDAEVSRLDESAKARFDKERPEIFKRREIVAKLDVNKIHLGAERRLINEVFALGLDRLKGLDDAEYAAFCARLLKSAVETGDEEVETAEGEQRLNAAWVDAYNKANGAKLKLSERKGDFSGGFVLSKGRIAVNCTLDMLVQVASEKMENEVVRRLFSA
jgi:V/A-type H+-transporting ATPase subunit E